jgi:hypothetical protein
MLCSVVPAFEEVISLQHPNIRGKTSNVAVLKTFHSVMLDFKDSFWSVHTLLNYTVYIQGVSRLVDITAGDDFLGLCDQKKFI